MTAGSRLAFSDLTGWDEDDHAAAYRAFLLSARRMRETPPRTGGLGIDGAALARVAASAPDHPLDRAAARAFFEARFEPREVVAPGQGFLTGYFEPELAGSRIRTPRFATPLLARPDDLVEVTADTAPPGWDPALTFARRTPAGLVPYYTRAEIEDGALAGRGLELVWLERPVDAFFAHVQGSVRIRFDDGSVLRLAYAGKTGHPYTSIGRVLVERGVATPETMTGDLLIDWIVGHGEAGRELMRRNLSYIFFRVLDSKLDPALGAVAAAGVQITPGRSLAVDRTLHTFGTPVWIDADLPRLPDGDAAPFRRLMLAQDTGSAIVGPGRGDVFIGSGREAGHVAGLIRHVPRRFVALAPRAGGG